MRRDDDDDEDDGEDGNFTAAFANPIQRKQKKGLDFSRWRELITDDPPNKMHSELRAKPQQLNKVGEGNGIQEKIGSYMDVDDAVQVLKKSPGNDVKELHADFEVMDAEVVKEREQEQDVSHMDIDGNSVWHDDHEAGKAIFGDTGPGYIAEKDLNEQYMSESLINSNVGYNNLGKEQGATTLDSQIDAENRARLQRMSADEIAEAQGELMEKLNPALRAMLQKRGQNKLNKQEPITPSDIGTSSKVKVGNNESTPSQSNISHKVKTQNSTHTGLDDNLVQKNNASSLWEAWSKRVESVRDLRFSLDGNVIRSDIVQLPNAGKSLLLLSHFLFINTYIICLFPSGQ